MMVAMRAERPFQAIWMPMQKQNEGDHAQDSVGRGGRDFLGDPGGVGVAEIDQNAEDNDREKYAKVGQDVVGQVLVRDVRGDGEQCDERARPRGDGKGEGIEDSLFEMAGVGNMAVAGLAALPCFLFFFAGTCAGAALIEHAPSHGGDDDAAGKLDDGQGDAEEAEDDSASNFKNAKKDDVVDGDAPGKRAKNLGRRVADQPEKNERGAKRVDQRQQHAEGNEKDFPDRQEGSPLVHVKAWRENSGCEHSVRPGSSWTGINASRAGNARGELGAGRART